jgi:cytochrome oxidase assembly protein ShyY1
MLVGPRNKGGPGRQGYYVYTPFVLEDGKVVIVNRGWIPAAYASQESRVALNEERSFPSHEIFLQGMLRQSKYYHPAKGLWQIISPSTRVTNTKYSF